MKGGAGKLTHRVAFDAPVERQNGQGGMFRDWDEGHRCWGGFRWLRGGEAVIEGRLAGRQPVVVTIRRCAAALRIGTDWRMRDLHDGERVFAVRSIVPTDDRAMLEITCEGGVSP